MGDRARGVTAVPCVCAVLLSFVQSSIVLLFFLAWLGCGPHRWGAAGVQGGRWGWEGGCGGRGGEGATGGGGVSAGGRDGGARAATTRDVRVGVLLLMCPRRGQKVGEGGTVGVRGGLLCVCLFPVLYFCCSSGGRWRPIDSQCHGWPRSVAARRRGSDPTRVPKAHQRKKWLLGASCSWSFMRSAVLEKEAKQRSAGRVKSKSEQCYSWLFFWIHYWLCVTAAPAGAAVALCACPHSQEDRRRKAQAIRHRRGTHARDGPRWGQ